MNSLCPFLFIMSSNMPSIRTTGHISFGNYFDEVYRGCARPFPSSPILPSNEIQTLSKRGPENGPPSCNLSQISNTSNDNGDSYLCSHHQHQWIFKCRCLATYEHRGFFTTCTTHAVQKSSKKWTLSMRHSCPLKTSSWGI